MTFIVQSLLTRYESDIEGRVLLLPYTSIVFLWRGWNIISVFSPEKKKSQHGIMWINVATVCPCMRRWQARRIEWWTCLFWLLRDMIQMGLRSGSPRLVLRLTLLHWRHWERWMMALPWWSVCDPFHELLEVFVHPSPPFVSFWGDFFNSHWLHALLNGHYH